MLEKKPVWLDETNQLPDFVNEKVTDFKGALIPVGSNMTGYANYNQLLIGGTDVVMTSMREQNINAFTSFGAGILNACVLNDKVYIALTTYYPAYEPNPPFDGNSKYASLSGIVSVEQNSSPMDFQFDSTHNPTIAEGKYQVANTTHYYVNDVIYNRPWDYSDKYQINGPLAFVYYGDVTSDEHGKVTNTAAMGTSNVGVPFPVRIRTMPAHVATNTGDNLYLKKRIVFSYLDMYRSYMTTINDVAVGGWTFPIAFDEPVRPITQIFKTIIPSNWKREQQLVIESKVPLPLQIRGLSFQVTI